MRRKDPALRLTMCMSNIVVVPCFHKAWALTSALDFSGTSTCPDGPINIAAPFTVLALPS